MISQIVPLEHLGFKRFSQGHIYGKAGLQQTSEVMSYNESIDCLTFSKHIMNWVTCGGCLGCRLWTISGWFQCRWLTVVSFCQTFTGVIRLCQAKGRKLLPATGIRESTRACVQWAGWVWKCFCMNNQVITP